MAQLTVNKNTVIYRESKKGNGVNLLIDGSFVYMEKALFEEKMADDNISHITVGEEKEIMETVKDKDGNETLKPTGRTSRSIIEFVVSKKAQLEEMKELQDLAQGLDPEIAALLTSLGVRV